MRAILEWLLLLFAEGLRGYRWPLLLVVYLLVVWLMIDATYWFTEWYHTALLRLFLQNIGM